MGNSTNRYPISAVSRLRVGTDGHGIRTLVVLNGCPLRCKYCLNKFTWDGSYEPELLTSGEVYDRIAKDVIYMIATNGGITFGGGEPLMFPELIKEMRVLSNGCLNINVETSLNIPWENISNIVDVVDNFTVDIKSMSADTYRAYTGCDNKLVIENLEQLIAAGYAGKITVRVPIIPNFADEESQKESADILNDMGIKHFDLFKYKIS